MADINNYPLVRSFKPIELLLLLFGYSYNTQNNRAILIYNKSIQIFYLVISFYIFTVQSPIFRSYNNNDLLQTAQIIQSLVQFVSIIIIFINNQLSGKYIVQLFQKLNGVDEKLRVMEICVDYSHNATKLCLIITTFLIASILLLLTTNLTFFSTFAFTLQSYELFLSFFMAPFLINVLLILYTNLCWEIKIRFDLINAYLIRKFRKCSSHEEAMPDFSEFLFILKLYDILSQCNVLLNNAWSFSLLAISAVTFTGVSSELFSVFYLIFHRPDDEKAWSNVSVYVLFGWAIITVIPVIVLSITCTSNIDASIKTLVLFQKYFSMYEYKMIYDEIDLAALQFMHQKSCFSAYGLFPVNLRLIFSMATAITTYLLILLQFDVGTDAGKDFHSDYLIT